MLRQAQHEAMLLQKLRLPRPELVEGRAGTLPTASPYFEQTDASIRQGAPWLRARQDCSAWPRAMASLAA